MKTPELAAWIGCARPSVSSLWDTLGRGGLVIRAVDPAVLISLTAAGEANVANLFPRFNAGQSELVAALSVDEQRRLVGLRHTVRCEPPQGTA